MNAVDLIAELADWKLFLLVIFIYSIFPQWLLRVLVHVWPKDDPRRTELLAELYEVPRIQRPFWVAEQFETALADAAVPRIRWALTGRLFLRWKLGSGVESNKLHPKTFWIPSDQEKAAVAPGHLVKLMFQQTDGWVERMWVRVTKVSTKRLVGVLENQPYGFPRLTPGDTVKFKPEHIIDIDPDDGDESDEICGAERLCNKCAQLVNPIPPKPDDTQRELGTG